MVAFYGETTFPGPGGGEVVFWPVPPYWAEPGPGGVRVLTFAAGDELRGLGGCRARRAGCELHSALWVITADREQLRQIGRPGLARGWPDLAAALAWLDRNPRGRVAAGVLLWLAGLAGFLRAGLPFRLSGVYDRR